MPDQDLFVPLDKSEGEQNQIVRPSLSYWQDAWIRFRKNKVSMFCLFILTVFVVLAIVGPMISQYDYRTNNVKAMNQTPNSDHWFGTDTVGRDLWCRIWTGAQVSLFIGFVVAMINQCVGIIIGGISGYFGGKLDMLIMRFIDVLYGIPTIIVAILLMVAIGAKGGVLSLIVAMTLIGWIGSARFIRGQVMQLKNSEFVLAAKALGANSTRIISRHLIPNTIGLIITNVAMAIPGAIFTEAFLSYIGIGIQPPLASWGVVAREAVTNFRTHPTQLFIVGALICITMLSLNLVGDGLRDSLDPRLRGAK